MESIKMPGASSNNNSGTQISKTLFHKINVINNDQEK